MIKIVSNIKKRLAVFLLSALLIGQGSGYLAQKLMVENNIRERIKDALSKIIDSNKYVINVDIDLDISDEVEEQITVLSEKNSNQSVNDMPEEKNTVEESLSSIQQSIESEEESSQSGYSVGLPIPGFEMDFTNSNKALKKATAIIAESESGKNNLLKRYNLDYERINIIPLEPAPKINANKREEYKIVKNFRNFNFSWEFCVEYKSSNDADLFYYFL